MTSLGTTGLLTAEQERELAQSVHKGQEAQHRKDEGSASHADLAAIREGAAARDRFIRANLGLVGSIVSRVAVPQGMTRDDLFQEGIFGLEHAVEKFDWRKGFKFSTYATWWIRQAVQHASGQASLIRLPDHQVARLRAALTTEARSDRPLRPTAEHLYRLTNLSSLDAPVQPEGALLGELLADETQPGPDAEAIARLDSETRSQRITDLLSPLTDRQQHIVKARFGLTGETPMPPMTLASIGDQLGISRERVRQELTASLAMIRDRAASRVAHQTGIDRSAAAVAPQHPNDGDPRRSLVQHGEAVLEQLRCWDKRWRGSIEQHTPSRVILSTTFDGEPGPSLRIADTGTPVADHAFVLHEAAVGASEAQLTKARFEATQQERRERARAKQDRRNARIRHRRATDPEWREKQNAKARQRLADDPERRARYNANQRRRERERLAADPERRERRNARVRERLANDPETREKRNAHKRELWQCTKTEQNNRRQHRRATDPEWREEQNAKARQRYANDPERRARENARKRQRARERRDERAAAPIQAQSS